MERPESRRQLEEEVRDFLGDSLVTSDAHSEGRERAMAVVGILTAYLVGRFQGRRSSRRRQRRRRRA